MKIEGDRTVVREVETTRPFEEILDGLAALLCNESTLAQISITSSLYAMVCISLNISDDDMIAQLKAVRLNFENIKKSGGRA